MCDLLFEIVETQQKPGKKCLECGTDMGACASNKKFCCQKCINTYHSKKRKENVTELFIPDTIVPEKYEKDECINCGTIFVSDQPNYKFCSTECGYEYRSRPKVKPRPVTPLPPNFMLGALPVNKPVELPQYKRCTYPVHREDGKFLHWCNEPADGSWCNAHKPVVWRVPRQPNQKDPNIMASRRYVASPDDEEDLDHWPEIEV